MSYQEFLAAKTQCGADAGFDPVFMPDFLFDFQCNLVEWAVRKGRAALFADCGLGKSPMELVWAENVVRHTNGRVLLLTALAVSAQIIQEAEKFGIQVRRSKDGTAYDGITVSNYERLHLFDPGDFVGVVCDESSILKNFSGARKAEITIFMRKMPYRLLATATAAPNDYIEEEREERRRTIRERCEKAASLIADTGMPAVAWCDLNDEGDLLEQLIPGSVQVSGKDSDDAKEEKLIAFSAGEVRVLVTKQKIAGFGMNWQHCAHMTDFPSHSYEGYYQKVRRFLRFGQKRPVRVDIVTTEGGRGALQNMQRKAAQADEMFSNLVAEMNRELAVQRTTAFTQPEEVPAWL